jgi:type I restriction enzyme M protein
MTNQQIKALEKELWATADNLRANSKLTASEYKDPVLGLILLRFAGNRFDEALKIIEENLPINPRTQEKRTIGKDDFLGAGAIYLQEKSKYEYLANLPESENINEAVNEAMRLVEEDYEDLKGNLPRNYHELDATLLRDLIRAFNSEAVKSITGDAFGRIYEYFLMKFSMSGAGAQEGGEFFTPPSLVQLIVNFIEPNHGIIHDPACGSGGMFVQTGHFVKEHSTQSVNEAITVYGTELKSNNTKLAKMNLAIHGLEGKIIEANSFYANPHNLTGKCDFVMANPPFNVKKVDKKNSFLKSDERLPFGLPKNDNGNYLWVQYFHSFLNDKGRAGFVMASSATDAGNTEKAIRQELIATGDVEAIVSVGNNFFYTRSLPCHVWFFNKNKRDKKSILMIDARNTFRVVNQTINDFSEGQLLNLGAIMGSYRVADNSAILNTQMKYIERLEERFDELTVFTKAYVKTLNPLGYADLKVNANSYRKMPSFAVDMHRAMEAFEKPVLNVDENIEKLEKQLKLMSTNVKAKKLKQKEIEKEQKKA